jgi:hypothetical protein
MQSTFSHRVAALLCTVFLSLFLPKREISSGMLEERSDSSYDFTLSARMTQKQDAELMETKNATKVKFKGTAYYECVTPKQSTENSGLKFRDDHKYTPKTPVLSWTSGVCITTMPFPRGTIFKAIVTKEINAHVELSTVLT